MPKQPPNILFLMSDEHRADVTGYDGNRVIRTPVLDELARTGVVFRNAYAASPICIPGRQAMMAGQFPSTCRIEQFGRDLPPGHMTFARRFSQFAYNTVACGKLHHLGTDQMQGWTRRLAGDLVLNERFIEGRDESSFERFAGIPPQRWKWSDLLEVHRTACDTRSRVQRFDRHATEQAIDFLEDYYVDLTHDRATPHRPLMLKLSLLQPHYPYAADQAKLSYYFNRVQPYVNEPLFDHPVLSRRHVPIGVGMNEATEREIRRTTAAYYGMIETIDGHYGSLLDQLRHVGQDLDDWIIVYTSDHGEMLGEHGIWEKQRFFEGSARVPLIIRWPRRFKSRVVEENVNLCDLFATLCELAQIPLPTSDPPLDSRSLVPLMAGDTRAWHEDHYNETVSQFGGRHLMIKRDALKYQWYGQDGPEVLFDLKADPCERGNCIDEPRYAQAVDAFRARRDALGFAPVQQPA
jgi:choline-sulfatase